MPGFERMPSQLPIEIKERLAATRKAAQFLRLASTTKKDETLIKVAELLRQELPRILEANAQDIAALDSSFSAAFRDRLTLDPARIESMVESLKQVGGLPDPVADSVSAPPSVGSDTRVLQNGLRVRRVRAPLGVLFMIFESRPNVVVEAFSLAFKSGNAIILRGGKESMRTTSALYSIIQRALEATSFPRDCIWGITNPDRTLTELLLQQERFIDVVVPRGGDGLIKFVVENSSIPIIKNDRGLCHVYIHDDADREMAVNIVVNSKTQRPGVCNAMETLLIHESRAAALLPELFQKMSLFNVEWLGCPRTLKILPSAKPADEQAWDTEYLDFKLNCRIVQSLDEAIEHIEAHGSRHSEAIVTESGGVAREFEARVDAAAVYWNASTRFTDGFELGLGGELGISTQKLHVRGPVGLVELTSLRWIIEGSGQVRK